ncbi:elongation of very long chain fatty acids protein AAEL008004-like [Anoplophora glabripennis]|uniref:elongation of very long chain fatty acids protein AAEL008004-like n=1 Tax=Anoplophora glabripennis TaxID=217634 RepID=UPI000874F770|nr:elongation of very long chain fatty acids protein AAEL008004-like [Anoplophora glabripennis]
MALVLKQLYHGYFWLFRDMADTRTDSLFMVSNVLAPMTVTLLYLYFVHNLGPKLMENRKPCDVTNIMRVYNVVQIVMNSYVVVLSVKVISNMDWNCGAIDYSVNPESNLILHVCYVYYLLKILDLFDTIFFVLRKSYRQISFLHLYHHTIMIWCIWLGCRFVAGGTGVWIPAINSFVHVVMYTYYLMATFDEKWKSITYKKLLTKIQLTQFMAIFLIFGRLLFKPDCAYPKWVSFFLVPQQLFLLFLFGDFYVKTYLRKKK